MGFQVGSTCYDSASSAVAAVAAREVGSLQQRGGNLYMIDVSSTTDNTITFELRELVDIEASRTITVPINVQPCGLLEWQDTLALGWLIVGAWIAVFALRFVARARLAND